MIPNLAYSGHAGTVLADALYNTNVNALRSPNIIPDDVFDAHRLLQAHNVSHLNVMNLTHSMALQSHFSWVDLSCLRKSCLEL